MPLIGSLFAALRGPATLVGEFPSGPDLVDSMLDFGFTELDTGWLHFTLKEINPLTKVNTLLSYEEPHLKFCLIQRQRKKLLRSMRFARSGKQ